MAQGLDFTTRQLVNPSAGVQQSLSDLGAMFGQFQKNKIDAEDKAEQRAQRALENKRAEAMLSIQQRQADQQTEKLGIDKATIAGTQAASQQLQNATQGLITPEQAEVIRKAYEANKKADVVGMQNKAQAVYEASPLLQRQYVSGVNISQDPTQMQVGVDELGKPRMVEVQGDTAKAQELKNSMLRDYDTRIQQDKTMAWDKEKFGTEVGLKQQQLAQADSHFRKSLAATEKAAKVQEDSLTKALKTALGKNVVDTMDPKNKAALEDSLFTSELAKIREAAAFGGTFRSNSSIAAEATENVARRLKQMTSEYAKEAAKFSVK